MSEFKGTPGPWVKGPSGELEGANGKLVREYGSGVGLAMTRNAEAEANGRLRNAAPELLEALQICERLIGKSKPPGGAEPLRIARAALAKALGDTGTERE